MWVAQRMYFGRHGEARIRSLFKEGLTALASGSAVGGSSSVSEPSGLTSRDPACWKLLSSEKLIFNGLVRWGYKDPAISVRCGTTLTGHFIPRAPSGLGWFDIVELVSQLYLPLCLLLLLSPSFFRRCSQGHSVINVLLAEHCPSLFPKEPNLWQVDVNEWLLSCVDHPD